MVMMISTNSRRVDISTQSATGAFLKASEGNAYAFTTSQNNPTNSPFATQLPLNSSPPRPSSRDSMRSGNADTGRNGIYDLEPPMQKTRSMSVREKMSIAAITEPNPPNPIHDANALLEFFRNPPKRPQNSPSWQDTHNFGHGFSKEPSLSATLERVKYQEEFNGQSQVVQNRGTSMVIQSDDLEISCPTEAVRLRSPSPQILPVQDAINSQSQEEITSFQRVLSSPKLETSPMEKSTENLNNINTIDGNVAGSQPTAVAILKTTSVQGPWDNIKKLRRADVNIPNDQETLLDRPDCWIPADVGQPTPQGHVPPILLREWNDRISNLFKEKRLEKSTQDSDQTPDPDQRTPPPSSAHGPLSGNTSDSDQVSWAASPPEHMKPARTRAVPPDSPPRRRRGKFMSREIPEQATTRSANNANSTADINMPGFTLSMSSPPPTAERELTKDTNVSENDFHKGSAPHYTRHPAPDATKKDLIPQDETIEPSDESDMETSIPQALTTSSQNPVPQVQSSDCGLDSSTTNSALEPQVQIPDTPAVPGNHKSGLLAKTICNDLRAHTEYRASSHKNNSSSQVIANSVGSVGNSSVDKAEMNYTQNSLVGDSQHASSNSHSPSLPSHQDSQRIPESSLISSDLHTQVDVRSGEVTREHPVDIVELSKNIVSEGNLKRKIQDIQPSEERSPKRARNTDNKNRTHATTRVDRSHPDEDKYKKKCSEIPGGPLRVFEMFKISYPAYSGNFVHFHKMCCHLQSCRETLPKNLWDEFIIRHSLSYPGYVHMRASAKNDWDDYDYEEYFRRAFQKPIFRHRTLLPHTLDIVAPKRAKPATADANVQTDVENQPNSFITQQSAIRSDKSITGNKILSSTNTEDAMRVDERPTQANIGVKMINLATQINKSRLCMIDTGIQVNLEAPSASSVGKNRIPTVFEDQPRFIAESQFSANNAQDGANILTGETAGELGTDHHKTANIEIGLESSNVVEGEALEDHRDEEEPCYDVDEDNARIDLISRIRRENNQVFQSLLATKMPRPVEDPMYLDKSTPFRRLLGHIQALACERQRQDKDCDDDVLIKKEAEHEVGDSQEDAPIHRWTWNSVSGSR